RPWLNSVPGHWDPQPGEPATTSLDRLGEAVEQALRQGARLWPVAPAPGPGGHEQPPTYVEFVLPYDLLNHDVAGLRFTLGHGRPLPLGLRYAVHLRSLERMRTDDRLVRRQWQERWRVLRQQGVTVHGWSGDDAQRLDAWQTTLAGESARTAVVLDAPADTPALEALKAAIAEGIALAIWDRRGVFVEERREVVTAVFASVPVAAQIPMAIHRLRRKAVDPAQRPDLLGRHIAFLWDDPTRLVDIHTDDGDLANEEAPAWPRRTSRRPRSGRAHSRPRRGPAGRTARRRTARTGPRATGGSSTPPAAPPTSRPGCPRRRPGAGSAANRPSPRRGTTRRRPCAASARGNRPPSSAPTRSTPSTPRWCCAGRC